ncbi:hypothetical protein CNR22_20860 [Sphingobacteriaceae bacterium]|nr:hypothetical protein CNR22_20860 [Sphingobacteriaceae bacterium]
MNIRYYDHSCFVVKINVKKSAFHSRFTSNKLSKSVNANALFVDIVSLHTNEIGTNKANEDLN